MTRYDLSMHRSSLCTLASILTGAAILTSALSTTSRAQVSTTLLVRVRDSLSGAPLPNAEVTALGRSALTDARGQVRILWPTEGMLSVRVRQLGFRFVQRTVQRGTSSTATEDTLTIALQRAAFSLPQMATVARPRCRDEDANAPTTPLSASAMELLRFGAEQYGTFRARYPFALLVERRTELFVAGSNVPRHENSDELTSSNEWGDRYFPGRVLQRTGAQSWFIPLLFVSALADSAFWARHCFVARGVEEYDGRRVIRLDFSPASGVNDTEWEGAALIDSTRSVLARVDFHLTNLRDYGGPRRVEGYTVFSTPSPYIARPDSTVVRWTANGSAMGSGGWSKQTLLIRDVKYTKETPP